MSANIGWLFYKDYFKDIDYKDLDSPRNEAIVNKKIENIITQTPRIEEAEVLGSIHFSATTTYPGLLLGSGNTHELPSIKGQAILGFHFDYTSGLPVIQGSSIKGVLRSAFKHERYIQELLSNETIDISTLESEIFDNGDTFFDATISKADGKILGDDYITPHKNHKKTKDKNGDLIADEFCDPHPLRFMKVLPDITFRFDFELSDGLITKEKKSKLFQHILEDLGLGAKTNVGYGKFEAFKPYQTEDEKVQTAKELELKKALAKTKRLQDIEDAKKEKAQKAEKGISSLLECKTLTDGFKLLKDSFGQVPKPTQEQKAIIEQYYKKQNKLSKSDEKVFKKYLK